MAKAPPPYLISYSQMLMNFWTTSYKLLEKKLKYITGTWAIQVLEIINLDALTCKHKVIIQSLIQSHNCLDFQLLKLIHKYLRRKSINSLFSGWWQSENLYFEISQVSEIPSLELSNSCLHCLVYGWTHTLYNQRLRSCTNQAQLPFQFPSSSQALCTQSLRALHLHREKGLVSSW